MSFWKVLYHYLIMRYKSYEETFVLRIAEKEVFILYDYDTSYPT
jgi:hypothetical protein